jgi:hypothetical protein
MILMRTLRNDYAKYAREDDDLESLVSTESQHFCLIVYSLWTLVNKTSLHFYFYNLLWKVDYWSYHIII